MAPSGGDAIRCDSRSEMRLLTFANHSLKASSVLKISRYFNWEHISAQKLIHVLLRRNGSSGYQVSLICVRVSMSLTLGSLASS